MVIAMQVYVLPELRHRAIVLQLDAERLKRQLSQPVQQSAAAVAAEHARQRFEALPLSSTAAHMDALARLHELAQGLQLRLEVGSYRIERREGEPLERMEIVVQGRGSYGQLRSFAMRALQDRALALNTVRWDRSGTTDASVLGEFQFTLFLRAP